jgi:hypothetical protein
MMHRFPEFSVRIPKNTGNTGNFKRDVRGLADLDEIP